MSTRWRLTRFPGSGAIWLVVEQAKSPYWGRAFPVESRHQARIALPHLRAVLEQELEHVVIVPRFFDPVEVDG